jgi:hypothetical protein
VSSRYNARYAEPCALGLQIPDAVQVDVKGMGDEYEVDSDADPEHDDNDNDAALLLALRKSSTIVAVVATRRKWIISG